MKRLSGFLLVFLWVFVLGSCQGSGLPGTGWGLETLGGTPALNGVEVTLTFDEDLAYGFAGCNPYSAAYQVQAEYLTFDLSIISQMTCPPAVMEQETLYLTALGRVSTFQVNAESQLVFFDPNGHSLAVFSSLVPTLLTDKNWFVTVINDGSGKLTSPLAGSQILANFTTNNIVFGDTGCNQYSSSYQLGGTGKMTIQPAAVTLNTCDQSLMEQETNYLAALQQVARYSLGMNTLELRSAEGGLLVRFTSDG